MVKEKGGFLTPKAIGNRIKAKGLQKLRWYCQMCQKQCRDENGFKCHCLSEAHQRQMQLFRDNPGQYMDLYSQEFEEAYVEIIRRKRNARLKANAVYQELVSHRQHIHMNSTKWETLTSFLQYLGKKGIAVVDLTPKGWFIKYIDKDPERIRRQEAIARKDAAALDEEERTAKLIELQMANAKAAEQAEKGEEGVEQQGEDDGAQEEGGEGDEEFDGGEGDEAEENAQEGKPPEKAPKVEEKKDIKVEMGFKPTIAAAPLVKQSLFADAALTTTATKPREKRKISAMELIVQENEMRKKREEQARVAKEEAEPERDDWLFVGLVVKVLNKTLKGGKYYKKKGKVTKITDTYLADVTMLDSSDSIKIDQEELETVIPAIDKEVLVVKGKHRGRVGMLTSLDVDTFSVTVKLDSKEEVRLPYESVCKIER